MTFVLLTSPYCSDLASHITLSSSSLVLPSVISTTEAIQQDFYFSCYNFSTLDTPFEFIAIITSLYILFTFYFKRILTVIEMLYNNHFQWSLYYWDMVHIEIGISWFSFLMDIVIFFGLNEYFQLISECLLVSKFLISVRCLILVAASFIHFCMCI